MRFGVFNHPLDFVIGKAGVALDDDGLFFAGLFVFGGDVEDTVGVDVEADFDLRHTARCGFDAGEVEAAQRFVAAGLLTFALQDVDSHCGLVVFGGREHLRFFGRDGGVFLDQLSHHAAHGFDTERQRGNVEQQHVFDVAADDAALDGSTEGDRFVRVHVFARLFAEEVFHGFLHFRHPGLAADKDNVVDVFGGEASVFQRLTAGFQRFLNQLADQRFQFGAGHLDVEVFRAGSVSGDIGQVNFRLLTR